MERGCEGLRDSPIPNPDKPEPIRSLVNYGNSDHVSELP